SYWPSCQVETLAQKNQHQQQIEHDSQRVVGLAQARFNAGIIAGSRVSEAKIPALREQCNGLLLQGQWLDASIQLTSALMPLFSLPAARWAAVIIPDFSG
ncbi:multidrug resistance system protein, partial [Salmonella enterica subsp. enterica serovar Inverness str. R8-3668]